VGLCPMQLSDIEVAIVYIVFSRKHSAMRLFLRGASF